MSEEINDVVDNVKQGSTWLRILLMLGFYVVLYVVGVVVVFVTLAQALFSLFTGSDNQNLRQLGASLSDYVAQILRYVTYNADQRPFPFNPFPAVGAVVEDEPIEKPVPSSRQKTKAATDDKKPARKRKTTAAKKTSGSENKKPSDS